MNPEEKKQFDDMYRMVRENNRMLHAARRNAWLGGIFKLILWAAFIIVPLWLYMQYMAPLVESMMQSLEQISGASAQAQQQYNVLQEYVNKLKEFGF